MQTKENPCHDVLKSLHYIPSEDMTGGGVSFFSWDEVVYQLHDNFEGIQLYNIIVPWSWAYFGCMVAHLRRSSAKDVGFGVRLGLRCARVRPAALRHVEPQ